MKFYLGVALWLLSACSVADETVASVASVPFELSTGRPVVEMKINGQGPFNVVFDTGAPGITLMKHTAEQLGLEVIDTQLVGSPAGGTPVSAEVVLIDTIDLHGAVVSDRRATVLDFGGPALGDGVIGPAVFEQFGRVALDFTAQKIEVGGNVTHGNADWITFGPSAPILDAQLTIGVEKIPAHIDTGAPHVIAVPNALADKLPLTGPVVTVARARTIDREFEIKGAPIDVEAKLGQATVPLQQIQFHDLPFANIGSGALRGLTIEIDWLNQRFAIRGEATPVALQPRRVRVSASDGQAAPAAPRSGQLDLSWLVGCWSDQSGSKEVWSAAEDGLLFGYGVNRKDGDVVFFEHLRIQQQQNDAEYVAYPGGGDPTVFKLQRFQPNKVRFANPAHDYPQLITYERTGDELSATISLMDGSRANSFNKSLCQ